jgi:hypothetical protein
MLTVVISFQRTIYNPDYTGTSTSAQQEAATIPNHPMSWYLSHLGIALAVSLVLLFGALALFSRLEDNFAEEI